jgi:hypothetical protein
MNKRLNTAPSRRKVIGNDQRASHGACQCRGFTSDLSGQDFWTLIRAGYAPLGPVMGSCFCHIAHQRFANVIGNIGPGGAENGRNVRMCRVGGNR